MSSSERANHLVIGCGYLGRRVAGAWLAQGKLVTALTRSPARALELSAEGIRPVIGDICDEQTIVNLPESQTILFAVGYDRSSGKSQAEVYVDGLRNVLRKVARGTKRFIYISSSSVYGQSSGEWVDESSECLPTQIGGQCCLIAEEIVRDTFANSANGEGSAANVLRLSGIYGPGRLLARSESVRAGEPIPGRGDSWLNLIHVDDAVRAVLACEDRGVPGQTYLVTDDQPVAREEYYSQLARLLQAPMPAFNPDLMQRRGSGQLNKRCSNRRLRDELLVELKYPTISEGLVHALTPLASAALLPIAGE